VSRALLEAGLLGQQHEPPAGAHLALVASIAVTSLVLLGIRRWRRHRAAAADEESTLAPHSPESQTSAETEGTGSATDE
jgi:hypothetical protein